MKEEHKILRKQSLLKTAEKRKNQTCKVFEIKFDKSHLSLEKKNYLNMLFLEAKWFYNDILNSENIFKYDTKIKNVYILNKEKEREERHIKYLSSQMKQSIHSRIESSIKMLSTKKKKGRAKEIGRLKFKSQINSIPLKQFGMTYKLKDNYVFLQGFKKGFKVIGLNQISKESDITNANLIRKNKDYYLKITTFIDKKEKIKVNNSIGLDFGIKDNIVDNFGNKYNFNFPETKQIKKYSKKLNKSKKDSKNRSKIKLKLNKKYEKNSNRKKDIKNKFVSILINNFDYVCIQNEQIRNWSKSKRKGWGRRIHHSIMGGIISGLKQHPETLIIDRFFPSTKMCPECGKLNKPSLEDRLFVCECGYQKDRDTHSASNIRIEGLKQIGMEHTNTMPVEKMSDFIKSYDFREQISMKQEAQGLILG